MKDIIQYFAEVCINRFIEEQKKFFESPHEFANFEKGITEVAHLREYYYNGGNMLELARYQKRELPKAAGAEELELSAYDILKTETARRTKYNREVGKYAEIINHTLSLQSRKKAQFMIHEYL